MDSDSSNQREWDQKRHRRRPLTVERWVRCGPQVEVQLWNYRGRRSGVSKGEEKNNYSVEDELGRQLNLGGPLDDYMQILPRRRHHNLRQLR